ncbi:MAG TPA: hypothetical protein VH437_03335 [Terriglobales bacterium]
MIKLPLSAAPRPKIAAQVANNIRSAMKGKEAHQVANAVRQGQMQADFLILLVNRTNAAILNETQVRWLKIALLHERLRVLCLSDAGLDLMLDWVRSMRTVAIDFLAVEASAKLIQQQYFERESVLLRDAIADIQEQTKRLMHMVETCDKIALEHGAIELARDHAAFSAAIELMATEKAELIVALARSKMLDDFGEPEAADALIKPYFLRELDRQA